MDFEINIREEAVQDLNKGYSWYENQQKDLGKKFLSEVESSLKFLRKNPEAFPKKRKSLRELTLKTFPYLIIYSVEESSVTILAIFNSFLNPNKKPSE